MDDRRARARDRLERPLDQLWARLREHRDRDAVGDELLIEERAHEVEVGLRRGGEADLDLRKAELEQQREEPALAVRVHGIDERLVAVAQVGRAPDRRGCEDDVRPRSIGKIDGRVRRVFVEGHRHGGLLKTQLSCRTVDGYVRRQASPSGEGGGRSGGPSTRARPERYAFGYRNGAEKGTTLRRGFIGRDCGFLAEHQADLVQALEQALARKVVQLARPSPPDQRRIEPSDGGPCRYGLRLRSGQP